MRLKDHKRFAIATQHLVRKAKTAGVVDLTSAIRTLDFTVTDPEVLKIRDKENHYLLSRVGFLAIKAGNLELAEEVRQLVASLNKGGVKRVK
jgi:uncharacterized membrane protein YkgB